jgi:hypothetical protein
VPYHPPLPAEMPGDEAIKHIRQAERRTEARLGTQVNGRFGVNLS